MSKKLTWQEINEAYSDEWIQLVDYDWADGEADPQAGVVRIHSKDSKEFHRLVKETPVSHSAILFVGEPIICDEQRIFNANQRQWFGV